VLKAGTGTTSGGGTLTVTFATAFPNACIALVPVSMASLAGTNGGAYATSVSTTGGTIAVQRGNGNDVGTHPMAWIAIGY
jgi:hypothetical protein